jgi:hypothetical protein
LSSSSSICVGSLSPYFSTCNLLKRNFSILFAWGSCLSRLAKPNCVVLPPAHSNRQICSDQQNPWWFFLSFSSFLCFLLHHQLLLWSPALCYFFIHLSIQFS